MLKLNRTIIRTIWIFWNLLSIYILFLNYYLFILYTIAPILIRVNIDLRFNLVPLFTIVNLSGRRNQRWWMLLISPHFSGCSGTDHIDLKLCITQLSTNRLICNNQNLRRIITLASCLLYSICTFKRLFNLRKFGYLIFLRMIIHDWDTSVFVTSVFVILLSLPSPQTMSTQRRLLAYN